MSFKLSLEKDPQKKGATVKVEWTFTVESAVRFIKRRIIPFVIVVVLPTACGRSLSPARDAAEVLSSVAGIFRAVE